ncbi:MAG: Transcriptional regulator, GntR family, partial [uncultured Friedmanniella sp.]
EQQRAVRAARPPAGPDLGRAGRRSDPGPGRRPRDHRGAARRPSAAAGADARHQARRRAGDRGQGLPQPGAGGFRRDGGPARHRGGRPAGGEHRAHAAAAAGRAAAAARRGDELGRGAAAGPLGPGGL